MPPPDGMPREMITVLGECWNHEPEKRPTAEKLKEKLEELNKKFEAGDPSVMQGPEKSSEPNTNN